MAVKFLGYIDNVDEELGGKRRMLFGCASAADIADLPTTAGFELPSGSVTSVPADWSYALVQGGKMQAFIGGAWGERTYA
jgi:hypothetical protein